MKGRQTLSEEEIDRLMILSKIEEEKISFEKAAELLEISERQIYRIFRRIKTEGKMGVIHKWLNGEMHIYFNGQELRYKGKENLYSFYAGNIFINVSNHFRDKIR